MTGSEVAAVLERAAERISDPERWTTGCQARDAQGAEVMPSDPTAVAWCMGGAVQAEVPASLFWAVVNRFFSTVDALYGDGATPGDVNDDPGHTAALAVLR